MDIFNILGMNLGNLVILILMIYTVISIFRGWKLNHNPIDLLVILLIISTVIMGLFTSISATFKEFGLNFSIEILDLIKFGVIALVVLNFSWFINYVFELNRLFSLPFVIVFFVSVGRYKSGNSLIPSIILACIIGVASGVLFYNSIKNRNGITFTIFTLGILDILLILIPLAWFALFSCGVACILTIMGESGWFDKKIFYDREQRKKIQNVWVAKFVT